MRMRSSERRARAAAAVFAGDSEPRTRRRRAARAGESERREFATAAASRAAGAARAAASPTNRIREDLQHLRRRVLLHSRNRYLHQDRRLGPRRIRSRRDRQLARPVHVGRRRSQQPHRLDRLALPRPYGHLARRAHPDRIRHRARLQPLRLHGGPRPIRRPACSTPSARSSRSPASPSARRSPTSTSSAARSATAAATAVTSRSSAPAARSCSPTRQRSATASPRRSRSKTARQRRIGDLGCQQRRDQRARDRRLPGPDRCRVRTPARIGGVRRSATTRAHSVPDIVGSLRVDQAWGSAQISAAAHQLRGGWYGNNSTGAGANGTPFAAPSDTFGFAVDAGVIVNLPWAKGDRFYVEGAYSEGAPSYAGWSGGVQGGYAVLQPLQRRQRRGGLRVRLDLRQPGRSTGATGHQLTTSWTIGAGIEHYWTPALRSSVFGSYNATTLQRHGADAVLLVAAEPDPHAAAVVAPTGAVAFAGCNPDFNVWNVGTRTIWNPVPNLDIGLEVDVHQARDQSTIRRSSRSTSRVPAVVRSASTRRRARTCSPACSASSATSGHDRLITAHDRSGTPGSTPGVLLCGLAKASNASKSRAPTRRTG